MDKLRNFFGVAIVVALFGSAGAARAYDVHLTDDDDGPLVTFHGFASQGFILSAKNNYLSRDTTRGSFQFSELGLNTTVQLTDNLRVGAQAFVQDLGPLGNYVLRADWFNVDYRCNNWFGVRFGRMKIPTGFYNEINDIDVARNSILLPQSVYPIQSRQLLYSQTGAEIYGFLRNDAIGGVRYQAYAGRIYLSEADLRPATANYRVRANVPWVVGARLIWETPLEGLRAVGSVEAARLDIDLYLSNPDINLWADTIATLGTTGLEYFYGDSRITAEFVRTTSKNRTNAPPSAMNSSAGSKTDRFYVQVVHRFTEWLQPGIYYSLLFDDVNKRGDLHNTQHDLSGTLRFDINDYLIFKAEGHFMRGVAGLNSQLRLGEPVETAAETWGVFFLKTTGYF